jgi:hypothetical protein
MRAITGRGPATRAWHTWPKGPHLVATTSKERLRPTPSRVTVDQLAAIRRQIALAVGIEG